MAHVNHYDRGKGGDMMFDVYHKYQWVPQYNYNMWCSWGTLNIHGYGSARAEKECALMLFGAKPSPIALVHRMVMVYEALKEWRVKEVAG